MTIQTRQAIVERIYSAPKRSPFAVFAVEQKGVKALDCIPANTVSAQLRITANDPALIGIFHKCSDLLGINDLLRRELECEG